MNILAIDDERDTLLFLKDLLTQAGHRVTAVDNGVRAMAAVQIEPVDVVLLDLMMPGTDGYQVARFLSENWKTYEIPVVVLSCCRDDESKSLARVFGCVRYFEKPFNPEELLSTLEDIDRGQREEVPLGG